MDAIQFTFTDDFVRLIERIHSVKTERRRIRIFLELLELVILGGVGTSANGYAVMTQMIISSYFEIKFLFTSIKERSVVVKMMALLLPLVLIVSYLMVAAIGFGSFLSGTWDDRSYLHLAELTMTPVGVYQILASVALFFLLLVLYSLFHKMSPLQWMISFGLELVAAMALLVFYGSLFFESPIFTVYDLCRIDAALIRWPIFGIFALLFKNFILLTTLVIGTLLKPRKSRAISEERQYADRLGFYQKETARWLTKDYRTVGISLLLFGLVTVGFLGYLLRTQSDPIRNAEELMGVFFVAIIFTLPLVGSSLCFYWAMFPKRLKSYQLLAETENQEAAFALFYEEMVAGNPKFLPGGFNRKILVSEHFVVDRNALRTTVAHKTETDHIMSLIRRGL